MSFVKVFLDLLSACEAFNQGAGRAYPQLGRALIYKWAIVKVTLYT